MEPWPTWCLTTLWDEYHFQTVSRAPCCTPVQAARLVHKCCDARSALEAEAYALGMAGYVLLEKEVQWERALSRFMRAK
eukprot:1157041-Pelagomonas_calceolata.AAC.6